MVGQAIGVGYLHCETEARGTGQRNPVSRNSTEVFWSPTELGLLGAAMSRDRK